MSKRINLPGTGAISQGYAPLDAPIKEHTVSGGGIREQQPIELGDLANDEFFDEVARIRDGTRNLDESITVLQTKHALSLQSPSDALSTELASLSAQLSSQVSQYRSRISSLSERVGRDEARRGHWENLKAALGRAVERWQRVERDHREKVGDKIARQMRIVNPAVSEQEIKAAVDTSSSASGPAANQIFAQALVGGSRTAAARTALDEAQTRRSELLRIEETLTELAALMQQVADLVVVQDIKVVHLEQTSHEIEVDVEKGAEQLGVARVSAAAARHKRKLCAAVVLALVVVVVVVVVVQVKQSQTT